MSTEPTPDAPGLPVKRRVMRPSGGKCCVHAPGKRPRMVYGHGATNALIRKLLAGEPIIATGKPLKVGKPTVACPVRGCRARLKPIGVNDHVRDCHPNAEAALGRGVTHEITGDSDVLP